MTATSSTAGRPRDAASDPYVVDGNRLTLLTSGRQRLDALIAMIDGAQRSLRVLYYIFTDDECGRAVRAALGRAARRGVDVDLIVDGFGSAVPDDFFAELQSDGADICRFLPRYGRRYLLRNHQKLVLADGETAASRVLIGGFNVEDDYFDDANGWRDLGLSIEGPAAARLIGYFDALRDWTHQKNSKISVLRGILARYADTDGGKVRWLLGGPTRRLSAWALDLRNELKTATRVDIISAYFAPNPKMMRAVERVVARGGQARVITPSKSDHGIAVAAARHTFARLLRRGVKVYEYTAHKLHTKLFVLDDHAQIGSANFDMRSLYLNLELMVRIEDQGFADYMRGYFDGELANSDEITAAEHARASLLDRLRWGLAYFIMAVVDANVTRRLNFGVDGK